PKAYLGREARIATGQGLLFRQAQGQLAGSAQHDVQAQDLRIEGTLALDAVAGDAHGDPLFAHLTGAARRVEADGASLSLVAEPVLRLTSWQVAAGLALVVVAATALERTAALLAYQRYSLETERATQLRVRLALGFAFMAERSADWGRFRVARYWAWRSIRSAPDQADGYVIHSDISRRRNDYAAVFEDHKRLHAILPAGSLQAINACDAAAALCRLNRATEAVQWLQTAEAQDHATVLYEVTRPDYALLGQDPYIRALRLRAHHDGGAHYIG
ncbi:MAG: hypothetical protein ABR586_10695, partial [Thermoplasmatota archaeon]